MKHRCYDGSSVGLKPHPVVVSQECSVCGLEWSRHGDSPTAKTCIDLLRADVSAARIQLANRPYAQPIPLPPFVPVPWTRPYGPYFGGQGISTWNVTNTTGTTQQGLSDRLGIPRIDSASASYSL